MAGSHSFLLPTLALLFGLVSGDTCRTVENAYRTIQVAHRGSAPYRTSLNDYWNKALSKAKPTCIIYPASVRDAQRVIDVLGANTEQFAIKAGGLMPNPDFSSTSGGPIISLAKMKQMDYDPFAQTIRVGPAVLWQDIVSYLIPYKRTVVGARLGNVAVSGMLLGGGLSFLSPQYGWASTQVAAYEVVLANGTAVNATETQNTNLRRALQTGGNAFGLVTAFTLRTVPLTDVWGGVRTYDGDKTAAILMALRDFTERNTDPKASIMAGAEMKLFGRETDWVVFYFYDGANPPPGVFDEFKRIPHIEDHARTQRYDRLLYSNNDYYRNNTFNSMSTETLPLPSSQNGDEVLTTLHNFWARTTLDFVRKATGSSGIVVYQPVPKAVTQASARRGGNIMMDLAGGNGAHDGLIVEFDYSYVFNNNANAVSLDDTTRRMFTGANDLISQFVRKGSLSNAYRPLFMNSASEKQDFWARSSGRPFARSVKSQVDPGNLFGKRARGWVV